MFRFAGETNLFVNTCYSISASGIIKYGFPSSGMCRVMEKAVVFRQRLANKLLFLVSRTSRPMSPMPDFTAKTVVDTELTSNAIEAVHNDNIPNNDTDESDLNSIGEIKCNTTVQDELGTKSPALSGINIDKRSDKNSLPRDTSVDTLASKLYARYTRKLCVISVYLQVHFYRYVRLHQTVGMHRCQFSRTAIYVYHTCRYPIWIC